MGKDIGLSVLGLILLAFLLSPGSWGAEKKPIFLGKAEKGEGLSSGQPLRVTSQHLEADHKKQVIIFRGNVVAKQGEMTIYADLAQIYYDKKEEGNEVREIVALGNVKIRQGDRVATGQKGVFLNGEQKIILTGNPRVWQGKDMVSGERITFLLEEDKSIVEGAPDRRVEVIIYPKGEGSSKKGKP